MDLKTGNETKKGFDIKAASLGVLNFLKKKIRLIIFLIILIFALITGIQVFSAVTAAKLADANSSSQSFEDVVTKDISNAIAVTGTIASNEQRTLSTLVAKTEVEKVYVEVGDYVNVGDPICSFDTSSIESNIEKLKRQIQVNNAKSTLALAKANTQVAWALEDYLDDQADGDYELNSAMISYQQQQNSVTDAIAALEDRERALDKAKDEYHDYKKAKRDGTLSDNSETGETKDADDYKEDIRDAEDAVSSASRSLQNAELSLQNSINSYNKTVESLRDKGREDLRTISSNMASVIETQLSNMTVNDETEERIREYEESLDNCKITAPISGLVTSLSVVEGDEYEEKSTICVIQDDSSYKVTGTVDQYDVSSITESMNCVIKTDATGDDQMEGVLTFVSPVPGSSSSSSGSSQTEGSSSSAGSTEYPIEITIKGRDDRLRIGMTAEASIQVESREGVMAVPYDAISEEDGKFYVNLAQGSLSENNTSHAPKEESFPGSGEKNLPGSGDMSFPSSEKDRYSDNPVADLITAKIMGKSASELYSSASSVPTKKVEVQKGLETDYYTEVISDEIKAGDRVLIPESDKDSDFTGFGPGGPPPRDAEVVIG